MRCKATTTRGRACAYIAVNGASYCFLHADYDTNPPPRRGGAKAAAAAAAEGGADKEGSADSTLSTMSTPSLSSVASSRRPSPFLNENSVKKKGRRTNAKLAELHADSPYPLLSMLSTDEWFGKKVTIAVGPIANRAGTVEKWGNGWVSVRVPDIGLHNRRSFELYLAEDESNNKTDEDDSDSGSDDESNNLLRCVSRDATSPSPPKDLARLKTPTFGLRVESSPTEGCDQLHFTPVTPRTDKEGSMTEDAHDDKIITKTPLPDHDNEPCWRSSLPEVTPVSPKKACELPLVDSMVLTRTGEAKKYKRETHSGSEP
jgi:hypothetical protein